MATAETRTWADDITDARNALSEAETAIRTWRAHLDALEAGPGPGCAFTTRRAANIATNLILDAAGHTGAATTRLTGQAC